VSSEFGFRFAPARPPADEVEAAIVAEAEANPTDGYRMVTAWVRRRLGRRINRKRVLRVMRDTGRTLSDLAGDLTTYPQVLVNVRVGRKADLRGVPALSQLLDDIEGRVAGHGRLLVRYSGTEPLLRIMLEGRDEQEIRRWANELADAVKLHL